MGFNIKGDVFIEPCNGEFLVYAPLHKAAFVVEERGANFIRTLQDSGVEAIPDEFADLAGSLTRIGILGDAPAKPQVSEEPHNPTQALLLLTANCNLRCTYCFSHGGESKTNLPAHVARAAIDLIVANAAKKNAIAKIRYHGGGEPTLRWETLVSTAQYLRDKAQEAGIGSHVALNTNGVLTTTKIDWIAKHIDSIYISFDGRKDLHDSQRPLAGGGSSFSAVWKTMETFTKLGKGFAIRSTITADNCDHMAELVDMVADFKLNGIELEPLTKCGRAYTSDAEAPTSEQYINAYKEAFDHARARGIPLLYSGVRIGGVSQIFCGAAGRNFAVTPSGQATLCHRVSDPTDPSADTYIYGGYSDAKGGFEFDQSKIDKMADLHCESSDACRGCFAKWNCGGGCYSQNQAETGSVLLSEQNEKCEITRELTKFALLDRIKHKRASQ